MWSTPGSIGAVGATVGDHAADRDAAEADAMVGALATDQTGTLAFAAGLVIGQGDLERAVARLGAGIGEEHAVQVVRHLRGDP